MLQTLSACVADIAIIPYAIIEPSMKDCFECRHYLLSLYAWYDVDIVYVQPVPCTKIPVVTIPSFSHK